MSRKWRKFESSLEPPLDTCAHFEAGEGGNLIITVPLERVAVTHSKHTILRDERIREYRKQRYVNSFSISYG